MNVFAYLLAISLIAGPLTGNGEDAGAFVAVGHNARRIRSEDGRKWTHDLRWEDLGMGNHALADIAYGLGRFVAVGGGLNSGNMWSTRDGKTWDALPQRRARVGTIAFGRARFVAAQGAELLHSTDGLTFHAGEKLAWAETAYPLMSAFGDGEGGAMFVIIGDADLPNGNGRQHYRATTSDGVTYNFAERYLYSAHDIAYGSGHFVVVGYGRIESSHDGQNWTLRQRSPGEHFRRVVWTGRRFLAQGTRVWESSDALHWSATELDIPGDLAWARDGASGISLSSDGQIFHASADLETWTRADVPAGPPLTAVAHGQE